MKNKAKDNVKILISSAPVWKHALPAGSNNDERFAAPHATEETTKARLLFTFIKILSKFVDGEHIEGLNFWGHL